MLIIPAGMENFQKIMLNPKNDGSSRYSQPLLTYIRKSNMAANDNIKLFTHHTNMACSMSFPTFLGSRNATETLTKSPRSMVDQIVTTCHAYDALHSAVSSPCKICLAALTDSLLAVRTVLCLVLELNYVCLCLCRLMKLALTFSYFKKC